MSIMLTLIINDVGASNVANTKLIHLLAQKSDFY